LSDFEYFAAMVNKVGIYRSACPSTKIETETERFFFGFYLITEVPLPQYRGPIPEEEP
jgi:hypothetical protein